jgi:hypothetical protein
LQVETWNTFQIQGTEVLLGGDPYLAMRVAEYFSLLYPGVVTSKENTLKFEVHPVEESPCLPPDAVGAIRGPYVCCYGWGKKVFIVSRSGPSMVSLDLASVEVHAFLDRELTEDSLQFFSLLGMTLIEVLKYRGLYFLHGACVYGNGRAYLFSGHSKSGKTTAAFNLVRQGFQFAADDSLFLSKRDGKMVVTPYYTHFHVDEKLVKRCPEIVGATKLRAGKSGLARMRVTMAELYPDLFVSSLTPDLIIFPRIVSSGASSFSPVSQMVVYERLLKQTILAVNIEIARDQLNALERLARQVKGFDLFTGPDVYEDPKILPALLDQMS